MITLSPAEAAAALRISERTLRDLRNSGAIGYIQITPRRIEYTQCDLDAFREARRRQELVMPAPASKVRQISRRGGNIIPFTQRK